MRSFFAILIVGLFFTTYDCPAQQANPSASTKNKVPQATLTEEIKNVNEAIRQVASEIQESRPDLKEVSNVLKNISTKLDDISKKVGELRKTDSWVLAALNLGLPLIGVLVGAAIGYFGVMVQVKAQATINYANAILSIGNYKDDYTSLLGKILDIREDTTSAAKQTTKETIKSDHKDFIRIFFAADERTKSAFDEAIDNADFEKAYKLITNYSIGKHKRYIWRGLWKKIHA